MTVTALLFMYESWRAPRALRQRDRIHNVLVLYGGRPIAAAEWRAAR